MQTKTMHLKKTFAMWQKALISPALSLIQNGHIQNSGNVNEHTQMLIASVTKPLTTLLLARLVDLGKLSWPTKVIDIYPAFCLADEEETTTITIEDLVSGVSGVPGKIGPMLFADLEKDPAERKLFDLLKTMKPQAKGVFQYNNQFITLAGYMAAYSHDTSKPMREHYMALMHEYVFGPLGMRRTSFAPLDENHATQHCDYEGQVLKIGDIIDKFLYFDTPAGGIWSTTHDIAKYLEFEINAQDKNTRYRRIPKIRIDDHTSYGLGLYVSDTGKISHPGGSFGFSSLISFDPYKKHSFVALTNTYGAYYDLRDLDEGKKLDRPPITPLVKSHSLIPENFIGTHVNKELGKIFIDESFNAHMMASQWKLGVFIEDEKNVIKTVTPPLHLPFSRVTFIPNDKASFDLVLCGQEHYSFSKNF